MPETVKIDDTPLKEAIEEAKRDLEKDGYKVQLTGIEKCFLTGYDDIDTPMTDLELVTCLENEKLTYRVFSRLVKKVAEDLDLKKPVWVIIFRLHVGMEMVAQIIEHTDQLEIFFQQIKQGLSK